MLGAVIFMLGLGAVCGLILSVASKVFYVYEDPRIAEVESLFAGANCGGCGFAGCSAAAVAVVEGKAPPSVCVVAGPESAIAVGAVMGVGLARGVGAIDLRVIGNIVLSWFITLPAGAILAAVFFFIFKAIFS